MNRSFQQFACSEDRLVRRSARVLSVLFALLLSACAAQQPQTTTTGDSVETRAQARWDALLARDFDTAYSLYSPGYRSSYSRVDFEIELRTRRIAYTSADVLESHCDGDACTVITNVGYRIGSPVPGVPQWDSERRMEERWVRTEGEWWFVPEG